MTETATAARTMRCSGCGANFTLARPEAQIDCPFCGLRQSVPEQLLAELREFREQFAHQQVAADAAVAAKADWKATSTSLATWGRYGLAIFIGAQALPLFLVISAYKLFGERFPVHPAPVAIGLYVAMYGGLYLLWRVRRGDQTSHAQARRAELGIRRISCPVCGAPGDFDARQTGAPCAYCGSALFPQAPVLGQSLDAARRAKREAILAAHRAEREGTAEIALDMRAPGTGPLAAWKPAIIGSLVAIGILGGVTKEMIDGALPRTPALFALWLVLPIGWAVQAYSVDRERTLRARLEAALQIVARQWHGSVDGSVATYIAWLDGNWAGPYEIPYGSLGLWFYSMRVSVGQYHALVELNLKPLHLQLPRAHVLLAAWIPGLSDAEDPAEPPGLTALLRPFRDRLSELGWSLELTPAGLVARLDIDVNRANVRRFIRAPESATALTTVLAQLGACARGLDAA